jgi:SAM-dependent methyltransferase
MARTIEAEQSHLRSVEAFYDRLAPDYDVMTTFEKRFVQESPFFSLLVQRYRIATALDAGCGTGFHSIVLARLGVSVTAVDLSSHMLGKLVDRATPLGLAIQTVQAGFADLPDLVPGPFNAIFSMGNTLAHLLTREELAAALRAFVRLLAPAGVFFAQVLNFDRILATRPEIQNVKETSQGTFIRSYEYDGDTIRFTIRKTPAPGSDAAEHSQSVELRPVLSREFSALLNEAGFQEVRMFGSIAMEQFDAATSKDLVILARSKEAAIP